MNATKSWGVSSSDVADHHVYGVRFVTGPVVKLIAGDSDILPVYFGILSIYFGFCFVNYRILSVYFAICLTNAKIRQLNPRFAN